MKQIDLVEFVLGFLNITFRMPVILLFVDILKSSFVSHKKRLNGFITIFSLAKVLELPSSECETDIKII